MAESFEFFAYDGLACGLNTESTRDTMSLLFSFLRRRRWVGIGKNLCGEGCGQSHDLLGQNLGDGSVHHGDLQTPSRWSPVDQWTLLPV